MPKFLVTVDTSKIPTKNLTSDQGTSFPASPVAGQFFFRTDLGVQYVYSGSAWTSALAAAGTPVTAEARNATTINNIGSTPVSVVSVSLTVGSTSQKFRVHGYTGLNGNTNTVALGYIYVDGSAVTGQALCGVGSGAGGVSFGHISHEIILSNLSVGTHTIAFYVASNSATTLSAYGEKAVVISEITNTYAPNDSGWIAPTFANSWVNFGGTVDTAGIRKRDTQVSLKGTVKSGTVATIFTLPAGYRPPATKFFMCASGNGSAEGWARVQITSDGQVTLVGYGGSGTNAFVALDQINFTTD